MRWAVRGPFDGFYSSIRFAENALGADDRVRCASGAAQRRFGTEADGWCAVCREAPARRDLRATVPMLRASGSPVLLASGCL